jgi:hypothetical protein
MELLAVGVTAWAVTTSLWMTSYIDSRIRNQERIMAKDVPVTDEIINQMVAASNAHDGFAAEKILEEVGSCGWSKLLAEVNNPLRGNPYGVYSQRESDNQVTAVWYKVYPGKIEYLATVSDLACESKDK